MSTVQVMLTMRDPCHNRTFLEGDILELIDGSLWVVKGCVHPGAPIAMPRLMSRRKIKRMNEALETITRYYPFFIKYVPELGKEVPVITPSWIRRIRRFLQFSVADNATNTHKSTIASVATELIELLRKECGLRCGPTGSILGGYAGEESDIDVNCVEEHDVLLCLRSLRTKGVLKPMNTMEFLRELPLVSETLSWGDMSKLVRHRLTQGVFNGFRYTLRVINCGRVQRFLGPYIHVMRNTYMVFRVIDFDYRTPSIYKVELLRPTTTSRDTYFITHRVRFTEVPAGTIFIARGDIMLKNKELAVLSLDMPSSKVEAMLLPRGAL